MRVLGVDPGLTRCGIGVVEGDLGRPPRLVAVDVIRSDHDGELGHRLVTIGDAIEAAIARYKPDVVAVERVFSQRNVRTVMGTAQVSGLVIFIAARAGARVALHTPTEVKASITGSGKADKAQVTQMVTRLLKLPTAPHPADAADALALAICQLWRGGAQARLANVLATNANAR